MLKLEIIIASTRPGRVGLPVGLWFYNHARQHGAFEVSLADLAIINLPFLDEPKHPRFQDYQHQHTKDWSARIDAADAIAIVTAEYNYGPPAPLVNAIDYLNREWAYKPVGFVSYGGVSGGTRSVQVTRQMAAGVRMLPIYESVNIPFVAGMIEGEGDARHFNAPPVQAKAADAMLDELHKLAQVLQPLYLRRPEPSMP
jgi:NAD(P)H-dependent FMN reductase